MINNTLNLTVKDKNILIQKGDRYISDNDIKSAIEDVINDNQLNLQIEHKIDLNDCCGLMFSVIYKGIVTIVEKINGVNTSIVNIVFEIR